MVATETLQVILNAKDQLSGKIREVNNALKQVGTSASSASSTATSATTRLSNAYTQLQSKVRTVFNNIKNTIKNSTAGKIINESSLAQPFLNAAEKIKQKWSSMTETLKSRMKSLTSSGNNNIGFNISAAGLATLNGQVTTTTGKVTALGNAMNTIAGYASRLGINFGTAFTTASSKIETFRSKLQSVGSKMQSLVGGLSGVQSAIMGAFGAVGVTSLSQFTIGAAVAREKLNAVTTSITGSEAATKSLNKAISNATSGGVVGFTKVAQAVQQIGIKYGLTNQQLEATAPVLNKIGTLARAMGKDSETAATIMSKAYDGLNGNFMLLQRNLGITKQQLLDAGWSGASNDVDGYTLALQKVLDTKPEMQEYLNSYEGQMERLKFAIQGVGRQIGEIFLPILNALLGMFLDLHQQCPWLTNVIVALAVGIVGLISVLSVLAPIIIMITELQEAQAFATLAANWPYLLLAAAILVVIGVLLYLYNTNEGVRNAMNKIGEAIKNTVVKAWEHLQKVLEPLGATFEHLMQVLGRLAMDLLGLFGITGDAAAEFDWLGAVISAVGMYIEGLVTGFVYLVEILASIVVPVISFLVNLVANLINFFISLAEALALLSQGDVLGFLTTLGTALWTLIAETITNFGQMFLEIFNNLNLIFGGVLTAVWTWLVQLIYAMILGGYQAVVGFLTWIGTLPGQFWNYLLMAWNNFTVWAGQIIQKAVETGSNMVTQFINWVASLPGKFWTWLLNTISKIGDFKKEAVQKIKDTAKQMVDDFIDWIKKLPSKFGEWLSKIKDEIRNRRGELVRAIIQLGKDLLNDFKNALLGSIGWSSAEVRNAGSQLYLGFEGMASTARASGLSVASQFNSGLVEGMEAVGVVNNGIGANSTLLTHVEHEIHDRQGDRQTELLTQIKDALGNLQVTHTGSIDFNQNVDVTGETSLSDDELREAVMTALRDKNILKQIVESREFQSMDKRMKNRMIKELGRHI